MPLREYLTRRSDNTSGNAKRTALGRAERVRVAAAHERSLEPCINGEVSATGKYVTQALEDRALEQAVTTQVAARKLRRYGLGE